MGRVVFWRYHVKHLLMRTPNPEDCDRSPRDKRRWWAEVYAFYRAFRFHDRNNHLRKAMTILFVVVWGVITVLLSIESIDTVQPPYYGVLTAAVFTILGRMWDIEFNTFQALVDTPDNNEEGKE
jgi:hypothetical protein